MVAWVTIALVGATTMIIKAAGPVVLGERDLPPRFTSAVELMGPALLAALVVTAVFGASEGGMTVDARVVGLGAAVAAAALKAPLLVIVVVAAASTAAVRLWVGMP
jgi:branched-subunit amino acid transport protein